MPRAALEPFSAVILTGGSSGIGKSFIQLGGKLKPSLIFCNLSRRSPDKFNSELKLNHFACDLARPEEIEAAARAIQATLERTAPAGQVLLINNSGFGAYGFFPEPDLPHHLGMIDVNVRAVVQLTGLLLPFLRSRGGAIMTIASTVAFQPTAYAATYGATKVFVQHWTLALNEELRGSGVRALVICPGPVDTPFPVRAGLRQGSVAGGLNMTADEVVTESYRALGAGRRQIVPGWKNKVYTFIGSRLSKPLAARLGAKIMARYRLQNVRR